MTKKENKETKEILVRPLNRKKVTVPIKGVTPLLMDRFPEDVMQGILDKQTGKSRLKKSVRNIKKEINDAVHMTSKGSIGFPAYGFKAGMMEVSTDLKGITKKVMRQTIRILNQEEGLIPVKFKSQDVLQHDVSDGRCGTNRKYTPQFHDWSCELEIGFDGDLLSEEDIVNLLSHAGFKVGIGAWRPLGKGGGSGEFGTYQVG